jgi:hypothetical protein
MPGRDLEQAYLKDDLRLPPEEGGELAAEEGHHPALLTEWGRTTVTWWTHTIRGLHRKLVDGEMILNPNCAWDVNMPLPGRQRPVRIQIKCSGERLARWPDKIIPASWEVDGPKRGRDEKFEDLGRGYHCDVFVFARHEGKDIDRGWHFYVL